MAGLPMVAVTCSGTSGLDPLTFESVRSSTICDMDTAGERVANWIQDHSARTIATQRTTVDGAKVTATFTCAVAATLVATALQVGDRPSWLDLGAIVLWLGCIWRTYLVFDLEDLDDVDHGAITGSGGSSTQQLRNLRQSLIAIATTNAGEVTRILKQLAIQAMWSVAVVAMAIGSLVWTQCPTLNW